MPGQRHAIRSRGATTRRDGMGRRTGVVDLTSDDCIAILLPAPSLSVAEPCGNPPRSIDGMNQEARRPSRLGRKLRYSPDRCGINGSVARITGSPFGLPM